MSRKNCGCAKTYPDSLTCIIRQVVWDPCESFGCQSTSRGKGLAHAFETPVKHIVSKDRPSGWYMFSHVLFIAIQQNTPASERQYRRWECSTCQKPARKSDTIWSESLLNLQPPLRLHKAGSDSLLKNGRHNGSAYQEKKGYVYTLVQSIAMSKSIP